MNASGALSRLLPGWLLGGAAVVVLGGCVSGRILEGYPGYPFLSFEVPAALDTVFFGLQRELEAEGFELDFTERDAGLINTRALERDGVEMTLSVIVDTASAGGSRVWVAGYEPVRGGARRIHPLREEAWAILRGIAARLSEGLAGTPPTGPQPRGDRANGD